MLLSTFIPLVPVMVGLPFVKTGTQDQKILLIYLLINFLSSIASVVSAFHKVNNLWMMNLYTPFQFGMLMWLLSSWQITTMKRIFLLTIPLFVIFWLVATLFVENFRGFNSYTRPLEALALISASGYTLVKLNSEGSDPILRKLSFWGASGILLYFTGMIVLFSLSSILFREDVQMLRLLWAPIQTFSNISSNIMFTAGFLCLRIR
jgi:hypothetical protein